MVLRVGFVAWAGGGRLCTLSRTVLRRKRPLAQSRHVRRSHLAGPPPPVEEPRHARREHGDSDQGTHRRRPEHAQDHTNRCERETRRIQSLGYDVRIDEDAASNDAAL